jgi:hypothetical protein
MYVELKELSEASHSTDHAWRLLLRLLCKRVLVLKYHIMEMYGGMAVKLHVFLTSALHGFGGTR